VSRFDPIIIGCCGANLASLTFALARLGHQVPVTNNPERVSTGTHVFLPGVGAAKSAMANLDAAGMTGLIPSLSQPVLGICLGMQLLFAHSEEEDTKCLGIIDADVIRLPERPDLPVPEMGWNRLSIEPGSDLLAGVPDSGYAYFVHSYAAPVGDYTIGTADYGGPFSAAVQQGNFFGTQFHPERSARLGSRILENFLAL
jgi:glutamine amidotransferase